MQRLAAPTGPVVLSNAMLARDGIAPGQTVLTTTSNAQQAYDRAVKLTQTGAINAYYTAGPVSYRRGPGGGLVPVQVTNPPSLWTLPNTGISQVPPMEQAGNQYRLLRRDQNVNLETSPTYDPSPVPVLMGTFNPARIGAFNALSQVPLGPYQAVKAAPADTASAKALGGGDLLPSLNMGGLVSQPAQLLTSLSALPALESTAQFGTGIPAADPVSVVRVRVAGVTGPNAISRARINEVAQQIAVQTGLTVDIVAGSSPAPVRVDLPAGKFGQPPLALIMDWVKKGVAVAILSAVDRQSVLLFALILVVCVLFVGNAATAATVVLGVLGVADVLFLNIRERAPELATFRSLGWRERALSRLVVSEGAVIGLLGSLAGAGLGLAATAGFAGQVTHRMVAVAVAAAAAGIVITVAAAFIPAGLLRRIPAAHLLAEE